MLVVGVRAAQAEKWDGWECEPHGQRCETSGSASRTGRDMRQVGRVGQVGGLGRAGKAGRIGTGGTGGTSVMGVS